MTLKNIKCICPDCFAEFTLDKAIGKQAITSLKSELNNLSEKEIQEKINAATNALAAATEYGLITNVVDVAAITAGNAR